MSLRDTVVSVPIYRIRVSNIWSIPETSLLIYLCGYSKDLVLLNPPFWTEALPPSLADYPLRPPLAHIAQV